MTTHKPNDAHTPGTGVAARPKPLARQRAKSKSLTRETPLQQRKEFSGGRVHSGKARFSFADDGAVLMLAERGIKSMRQEAGQ